MKGRIITGPERVPVYGSMVMVTLPVIVFYGSVLPKIFSRIEELRWLPLVVTLGFAILYYNMLSAHMSDPGIVPRKPKTKQQQIKVTNPNLHPSPSPSPGPTA